MSQETGTTLVFMRAHRHSSACHNLTWHLPFAAGAACPEVAPFFPRRRLRFFPPRRPCVCASTALPPPLPALAGDACEGAGELVALPALPWLTHGIGIGGGEGVPGVPAADVTAGAGGGTDGRIFLAEDTNSPHRFAWRAAYSASHARSSAVSSSSASPAPCPAEATAWPAAAPTPPALDHISRSCSNRAASRGLRHTGQAT